MSRQGKSEKYEEESRWYVFNSFNEIIDDATEYCPVHFSTLSDRKNPWIETQWRNNHNADEVAEWYAEIYYDNSSGEAFDGGRGSEDFVVIDRVEKKAYRFNVEIEFDPSFRAGSPEDEEIDWKKFEEGFI